MLAFRISVFCLAMYVVQSAKTNAVETYEDIDTNLNNVKINRSQYCENKLCMYKCCGKNEIMFGKKCKVKSRAPRLQGRVKYSEIPVTKTINGTVVNSTKRLEKDFEFIHNYKFMYKYRKNESASWKINHIWENGSASIELVKNEVIHIVEPNMFCVDYLVYTNPKKKNEIQLFAVVINQEEDLTFTYFSAIGMLVSCFFLALVLFVYGLLPSLRNLIGKVLMAYILSLFVTYLVRAILPFAIHRMHSSDCKTFSPVMYFAALSSFFWLKIMSFDLFWVIRGTRKCRAINRQGENMKFMWYCLYAWGVPLLITTFVVVLDNIDISKYGLMSPKFEKCFGYKKEAFFYLHLPIGIIISINTVLFFMTLYNIWLIKRGISPSLESRNTKKDINNFRTHMKLGVMMGISWILEILPNFTSSKALDNFWWTIIPNCYHIFIGVFIFFLFIFNKKIFAELCMKFRIDNNLVRNMQQSYKYSKSETEVRSLRRSTFKSSKNAGP